jgi:hypothetical protein
MFQGPALETARHRAGHARRANRRFYTDLEDDKPRYLRQPHEAFADAIKPAFSDVFGALPPKEYPPSYRID